MSFRRPRPQVALLMLAGMALVGAAALTWWQLDLERRRVIETGYRSAELLAVAIGHQAQATFDLAQGLIDNASNHVATRGGLNRIDARALNEFLRGEILGASGVHTLFLLEPDGRLAATSNAANVPLSGGLDRADLARATRETPSRTVRIGLPYREPVDDLWLLPVAAALPAADGGFGGVAGALLRLDHFTRFYDTLAASRTTLLGLYTAEGRVVARVPAAEQFLGQPIPPTAGLHAAVQRSPIGRYRIAAAIDQVTRLIAYRTLPGYPLIVAGGLDEAEVLAEWRARTVEQSIVVAIAAIGFALLAGLLARQLRRLDETQNRFELATAAASVGIWDWQPQTNRSWRSPQWYTNMGFRPDDPQLRTREDFLARVHPDDRDKVRLNDDKLLGGGDTFVVEYRVRAADGSYRWLMSAGRAFANERGEVVRIAGSTLDITEKKCAEEQIRALNEALETRIAEIRRLNAELELRVEERTAQLAFANRELESFAYTVSHDLRAPLRHIHGFSAMTIETCGAQLPEDGRALLQRIAAAALKMDMLIHDLLALARVSRAALLVTEVDLSELVRTVADHLREAEPARRVDFDIQPGLCVNADAGLMRIALDNLLSNAWKFTRVREVGHVAFGREETERGPAFFVRDDGAGFDMTYVGKLFKPFERLHTEREFEGTGIGLATVHRVITRHGGEIWADSHVNGGTTIHFTLDAGAATASTQETVVANA